MEKIYSVPQSGIDIPTPVNIDKLLTSLRYNPSSIKENDIQIGGNILSPIQHFPINSSSGGLFFLPLLSQEESSKLDIIKTEMFSQNKTFFSVIEREGLVYICSKSGKVLNPFQPFIKYIQDSKGKRYLIFTDKDFLHT